MKKCLGCKVAVFFVALGSINYLLMMGGSNVITVITAGSPLAARIMYGLIAFSGMLLAVGLLRPCPGCKKLTA